MRRFASLLLLLVSLSPDRVRAATREDDGTDLQQFARGLIRRGAWDGVSPIRYPLRVVGPDGKPAPSVIYIIREGDKEVARLTADTEGRLVIPMRKGFPTSKTRTDLDMGSLDRVELTTTISSCGEPRRAGGVLFLPTADLPHCDADGLPVYHRPSLASQAAAMAADLATARRALRAVAGTAVGMKPLLVLREAPGTTVITEGRVHVLWLGEGPARGGLSGFLRTALADHLADAPLDGGEAGASWVRSGLLEALDHEMNLAAGWTVIARKNLDAAIGSLDRLSPETVLDLTAADPRDAVPRRGASFSPGGAAARGACRLALFLDAAEGPGTSPGAAAVRAGEGSGGLPGAPEESRIHRIAERIPADRARVFPVAECRSILERERGRLEGPLPQSSAGAGAGGDPEKGSGARGDAGRVFRGALAGDAVRVALRHCDEPRVWFGSAREGLLEEGGRVAWDLPEGDGVRRVRATLREGEPGGAVPGRTLPHWFRAEECGGERAAGGVAEGETRWEFRVPVREEALPQDGHAAVAVMLVCAGSVRLLERFRLGRGDLSSARDF